MAVDRNGLSEALPNITSGSNQLSGRVLVSLCPLLPTKYYTKSRIIPEIESISMSSNTSPSSETIMKGDNNEVQIDRNITSEVKTETTMQETTVKNKMVRVVQTENLQITRAVKEESKELQIRPSQRMEIYNALSQRFSEVKISIPTRLLRKKYCDALQFLYCDLPSMMRGSESITAKLFAKFVIDKADKEKLKASHKIEGAQKHNELLVDILQDKSEEKICQFLEVLDNTDQKELADFIRHCADEIEKRAYNASILTQKQTIHEIGKQDSIAGKEIIKDTQVQGTESFAMILSTVPQPETQNQIVPVSGKSGHLLVGFTAKDGNDGIIDQVRRSFFKIKSDFGKAENIRCQCQLNDNRSKLSKEQSCDALLSLDLLAGEEEAYEKFEQNMLDIETVLGQKGHFVSIERGCIKFKVKVHDRNHLLALEDDIRCGKILANIVSWLQKKGYHGSEHRPMFMLVVDDDQIQDLKENLKEEEKSSDTFLNFPVSYTYCTHSNKWFWSADKTYWSDIGHIQVKEGIYEGKTPSEADLLIFKHLAENPTVKPEVISEYCIICCEPQALQDIKNQDMETGQDESESVENKNEQELLLDEISGISVYGLSFIFNEIVLNCFHQQSIDELKKMVREELERTFKNFKEEAKMEFTGDIFENDTCFFVGQKCRAGYKDDEDEGIQLFIQENETQPTSYLRLMNVDNPNTFYNGKTAMAHLIDGLNLVVQESSQVIEIEVTEHMAKEKNKKTYQHASFEEHSRATKEEPSVPGKSLPKLKGCLIKQRPLRTSISPTMRNVYVDCENINVRLDCSVNIAYTSVSWPTCAAEWILRHRKSGWPSNALIGTILTEGCHVVPVLDSGDGNDWKFCFEIPERNIIQSLTSIEKQTLMLFYMLCHDTFQSCGLPDHHQVKTIFLWGCETRGVESLHITNFGSFLLFLLDTAVKYIEEKHIPHYFIRDLNLLSGYKGADMKKAACSLHQIRKSPLETLFKIASISAKMPQHKKLEEIFEPVIHISNMQSIDSSKEKCLIELVCQLVAENKQERASGVFQRLPSLECKDNCLSKMSEEKIHHFTGFLPDDECQLCLEYLVNTFPDSRLSSKCYDMLGAMYHNKSLKETEVAEKEKLQKCADSMFQKALKYPSTAAKLDYAYFLYKSKDYGKAIETVREFIQKSYFLEINDVIVRPNFLYTSTDIKATKPLLLWPLAFALYITIKSCQAEDDMDEAMRYLKELQEACQRIIQTEGSNTGIVFSSFELLGAAASDLEQYQISSHAFQKLVELSVIEFVVHEQSQAVWKLIPASPSVNTNKFSFDHQGTKDFTGQFEQ